MASSTAEEIGLDQGSEACNDDKDGVERIKGEIEPEVMAREEADGASSNSSSSEILEKDQKQEELGLDEYLDDIIASNSILEELCRLQLSSGVPKEKVQESDDQTHRLCMPKLKLDKFDDLWFLGDDPQESETKPDDVYDLHMLRNVNFTLDVIVSEAIFSDSFPDLSDKLDDLSVNSSSSSSSISCDCESCETTRATEKMEAADIERLRYGWIKLRKGLGKIYLMVYKNVWNDPDQISQRPDLCELREIMVNLMKKSPFILTLKLQETLKTLVQEVKFALHNIIKEDSKSPALASNLISGLIDNYDRIRSACNISTPIFIDLENEYLSKFSVSWDLINKHMYQSEVASDPLLGNYLPICISQLRKSFPDKSVESRNFALVRRYLDFDVDMGNVASLWETTGATLTKAKFEETVRSAQDSALRDDWEKYVSERKRIERGLIESMCAQPPSKQDHGLENMSESLNKLLDNVADLGKIPAAIERDLLQAMDLESPFLSPRLTRRQLANDDDGNDGDDEVSLEDDLPFPFSPKGCDHVATLLGLGLLKSNPEKSVLTGEDLSFKRDISLSNIDQLFEFEEDGEFPIPWLLPGAVHQSFKENKGDFTETPSLCQSKSSIIFVEPSFASLPDKLIPVEDDYLTRVSSHQNQKSGKCSSETSLGGDAELNGPCCEIQSNPHSTTNSSVPVKLQKDDALLSNKEKQSLSATFPSILTAEGPKNPATWKNEELEKAICKNQAFRVLENEHSIGNEDLVNATENQNDLFKDASQMCKSISSSTDPKSVSPAPNSSAQNSSAKSKTKKSSTEIKQLFQQHYCSHKNKKKHPIPSAGAIRKGKVPPPPTCILGDDESTDELSEDSSSLAQDDTCSSASSMASHNANGTKQCSCCYCEFLGHNPNGSTTQSVAPVSRNYTAMRERLRLLLNKKKKGKQSNQSVQPHVPMQHQSQIPIQAAKIDQENFVGMTQLSSSAKETSPSLKPQPSQVVAKSTNISSHLPAVSATKILPDFLSKSLLNDQENLVNGKKEATNITKELKMHVTNDLQLSGQSLNESQKKQQAQNMTNSSCLNLEATNVKAIRAPTPGPNIQKRSQSATSLAPCKSASPILNQLEKSQSAVVSQTNGTPGGLINLKDVNELVDFIEGNGTCNEKKRAKKERQKLQRIEIIKANEREAKLKREAEEAERRKKEAEERAKEERERLLLKKQKKKAAQKAKKALEKGITSTDCDEETENGPCQTEQNKSGTNPPGATIEELRARQEQELYELLMKHRKQLEEEEKKQIDTQLLSVNQHDPKSKKSKKASKKGIAPAESKVSSTSQNQGSSKPQSVQSSKQQKQAKQQTKLTSQQLQDHQNKGSQGPTQKQQVPIFEPRPTQIKIQRSQNGVNFIPIYDNGEPATLTSTNGSIFSQSFSLPSATTSQTPIQHDVNSLFTKSKPGHPKATTGFSPNSTKTVEPNQPFVTIKRVSDPSACDETVTISSYDKENKLLYTLVNGEIHRAEGAPETLIPRAKPWTAELTTKLSVPKTNTPRFVEQFTNAAQGVRPPLPTDSEGKLDLERLQLPPGISITKIQGPVPERKFFPEHDQSRLPFNGNSVNPSLSALNLPSHSGYTTTEGLPSSLSGPNVILVDASTLPTREEERLEMERLKSGENSIDAKGVGSRFSINPNLMAGAYPYMAPKTNEENGYKKPTGPQYLIKNVNGNVTFTPIPDSKKKIEKCSFSRNSTATVSSCCELPRASKTRSVPGETFDDFNSIFAPKDIDLEDGNIDEDEREIEAFKRFCLDSIPLQQKTKVNFDMKNLTVKKK